MAVLFGILKVLFFKKKSKKVKYRAARFVTSNYGFETGSMTVILEKLRKGGETVDYSFCTKGAASFPTDDLIPQIRRSRNHHSLIFRTTTARTDSYKRSFFPQLAIGMPFHIR